MSAPLSRNSGSSVPDWMLKAVSPHASDENVKNTIEVKGGDNLFSAKAKIEDCAKTGKKIFVDKGMSEEHKSELKEYANVCGVKDSDIVQVSKTERKLAELKEEPAKSDKKVNEDPLNAMKGFAPTSSFDKRPMPTKAEPSKKMSSLGKSSGSVTRSDGIETYENQRIIGAKPGENSIASPNNIRQLADSKEKSTKDIILEQNEARRSKVSFDSKKWQKETAESLPKGYRAESSIKLTSADSEVTKATAAPGQHSIFDGKNSNVGVPDQTDGEKLAQISEERRASIQRPKVEDRSWDSKSSSIRPVISDLLYEGLKKRLGK